MTTTTKALTVQEALDDANPNTIADALKLAGYSRQLEVIKATFVGLTSAAAQDITTAAAKAAATLLGVTLETGENLPPIGDILTLRVTAGAAAAGSRDVTDAGGTASATLALISDDGKTLTFEAAVTAFILTYRPRAVSPPNTTTFAPST